MENELTVVVGDEEELKATGLLKLIEKEVDQAYINQLQSIPVNQEMISQIGDDFRIIYTPLHGTGNIPVRKALDAIGFKQVQVVKEQEMPDSNFSTVTSPNPEEHDAFELAIQYGERYEADILLGTDPDTDRVGVAVRNLQKNFEVLTGNQIGAILLHYLITEKKKKNALPVNATVLKTIVTSEIGRDIAAAHGLETIDTLTGFKFIGEKIKEFEETKEKSFLFGYEESYGYLIGDFVRDKDAVQACLLIVEVAAYYKILGMTLYEGLLSVYEQYGYYQEALESITLKGKDGVQQIQSIMSNFRGNPPENLAGNRIICIEDYKAGTRSAAEDGVIESMDLPKSNVLKYKLEDGSWFCLRPSGTEPKIKFYFGVKAENLIAGQEKLKELKKAVMERVERKVLEF
ncbi:phospho-sugar mutase [Planococcus sp. ANT_H30]|nr:phospho-sugar mutase [Planococcus sp. ANT_H30]